MGMGGHEQPTASPSRIHQDRYRGIYSPASRFPLLPLPFVPELDRALRLLSLSLLFLTITTRNVFDALRIILQKARLSGLVHR